MSSKGRGGDGEEGGSEDDIERHVLNKYPSEKSINVVEGPVTVGAYQISRVWTYHPKDDEYHAHYHVRIRDEITVYRDFLPFAAWLNREFKNTSMDVVRTIIASIVVLGALALVSYGFYKMKGSDVIYPVELIVTGVLSAAAIYLFTTTVANRTKRHSN